MRSCCAVQVVAFVKGTRTEPQCGFSHRVLTLLNEARIDYEVKSTFAK
jgi:glutaredoxin-related protein